MGADIHGFWELQTAADKWVAVKYVKDIRNYLWFSLVGGVRGYAKWPVTDEMKSDTQSPPWDRGTPENASERWKHYIKDDWLHDLTWLTSEEVTKANQAWKHNSLDTLYRRRYSSETPVPRYLQDDYEEVLTPTSTINQLFIGKNINFPWFGTVNDLIYKKSPFNECIRMVIGFDS
jgi:hypothetical protein